MSIKRLGPQTNRKLAVALPVPPLCESDLASVHLALRETASDWSVELHGIFADEATLVVLPDAGDDDRGPSFQISREGYGLRLDQVHWDVLTEIGVFASLTELVERLECAILLGAPATATLH